MFVILLLVKLYDSDGTTANTHENAQIWIMNLKNFPGLYPDLQSREDYLPQTFPRGAKRRIRDLWTLFRPIAKIVPTNFESGLCLWFILQIWISLRCV
jgi:hypothetical protein